MLRCGFGPNVVTRAFEKATAAISGEAGGIPPKGIRELPEAPHLITLWCSSPDYVDAQGGPRKLPARGPGPSLEALIRSVNRSLDLNEVRRYLLRTQTVRKVGARYALHRRWIFLRGVHGSAHSRSLRGLIGMLRTLEHNLVSPEDALSWFEFTAENPRFPVSQLRAFDQVLRREGVGCLRKLDVYMQRCEAERDPAEPTVWLGVGMHRFQQDALTHSSRRSRPEHRKRTATKGRPHRRGGRS
jgi:hypothetical protein